MRKFAGGANVFMTSLMNIYDEIRANLHFDKFAVGELLFVEYKCPIEQECAGVWTLDESDAIRPAD